jgi:hypothetical protein
VPLPLPSILAGPASAADIIRTVASVLAIGAKS